MSNLVRAVAAGLGISEKKAIKIITFIEILKHEDEELQATLTDDPSKALIAYHDALNDQAH